jgi:DNA-binding NarL/FixJ family response regulator
LTFRPHNIDCGKIWKGSVKIKSPEKFNCLIIDIPLFLVAHEHILKEVLGENISFSGVNSYEEADKILQTGFKPNLIIIDLWLNNYIGLDWIKKTKRRCRKSSIMVSSHLNEEIYTRRALRAGACGFVPKRKGEACLKEAIKKVMEVGFFLTDEMIDTVLKNIVGQRQFSFPEMKELSDRELEVFTLWGKGFNTSGIARHLGISIKTVETHNKLIQKKLHLKKYEEMIVKAINYVRKDNFL